MNNSQKTLLIIDDDRLFCDALATHLHRAAMNVSIANTGEQAIAWSKRYSADVVLLDQKLPDANGIDLCNHLLSANEQCKIIFITAFPSFDHAVQALRNGAYDYLSKPLELDELRLAINQAFRTVELEHVEQIQKFHNVKDSESIKLLGMNGGLAPIREMIERAATNRAPVLITGETGTGKTAVAKTIHYLKTDRRSPFIDTNCAALPENLIESELFGHEKGAFTGAAHRKKGLFEMADSGTLFLDEIGEMPLLLQSKLLGVLDSGRFRRLGGQTECFTDARIIAATNIDLEGAIQAKQFRQDLYYRMSVIQIHIPPLRQRKQDIRELTLYFLGSIAPDKQFSIQNQEIVALENYSWPGNVRELRNIIERAIILSRGEQIHPSQLLQQSSFLNGVKPRESVAMNPKILPPITPLATLEQQHIQLVLETFSHNRTQAAKALGIARSTLIRKLEQYNMN